LHGTPYDYLRKIRGFSHATAIEYLKNNKYNIAETYFRETPTEINFIYPKLVDSFHENLLLGSKKYFYDRTITDVTIEKYKLGKYGMWYTIPIYKNDFLWDIQLRKDDPKAIRFYYGSGSSLFNEEILNYVKTIYIVEGLTSCLVLMQNGIPSVCPLNGASSFSGEWINKFIQIENIYILFDNDDAGKRGAIKTAKILGEYRCKVYTFTDFAEHYDPNDWFIAGGTPAGLLELAHSQAHYAFQRGA